VGEDEDRRGEDAQDGVVVSSIYRITGARVAFIGGIALSVVRMHGGVGAAA